LRPEPTADLHPDDASLLGVAQGDKIKIVTPAGAIEVAANLTGTGVPGVVHMYHGYVGADVNILFEPDYQDPISGFPGFKSLLCRVERVAEPAVAAAGGEG
jgi:anaerobic selenocysteine-containing dehydrogenase